VPDDSLWFRDPRKPDPGDLDREEPSPARRRQPVRALVVLREGQNGRRGVGRAGDATVADVGYVSLRKGYDRWCAGVGGEASVLLGVPRGMKLAFQAVVSAEGVTVKRNRPIVVR
jgi:hypothetical protein